VPAPLKLTANYTPGNILFGSKHTRAIGCCYASSFSLISSARISWPQRPSERRDSFWKSSSAREPAFGKPNAGQNQDNCLS
jgi:hypothetical protein